MHTEYIQYHHIHKLTMGHPRVSIYLYAGTYTQPEYIQYQSLHRIPMGHPRVHTCSRHIQPVVPKYTYVTHGSPKVTHMQQVHTDYMQYQKYTQVTHGSPKGMIHRYTQPEYVYNHHIHKLPRVIHGYTRHAVGTHSQSICSTKVHIGYPWVTQGSPKGTRMQQVHTATEGTQHIHTLGTHSQGIYSTTVYTTCKSALKYPC